MQSYSEIECAFLVKNFFTTDFFSVCEFLRRKGFGLDLQSPGYVGCDDDFEYPEWTSLRQACEGIGSREYECFGVNFCFLSGESSAFARLSLEGDAKTKIISLKVGEEVFIDSESGKIKRCRFMYFVNLNQEISVRIPVKAWRIAQTGFDYDVERGSFLGYVDGSSYPLGDIEKTLSWYESEYITRWES